MGKRIYGVDTGRKITPLMVRDAIVRCFFLVHDTILDEAKKYGVTCSGKEMRKMRMIYVKNLIKKFFEETGGDFDNPTRESMVKVCDKLSDFSKNFRRPEAIKEHRAKIMKLLEQMEE